MSHVTSLDIDLLGECLLISSLTGKALRTLVDIARLAELDIKRREPGILYCFSLQTSDYDVIFDFCVEPASLTTSFKKYNKFVVMT